MKALGESAKVVLGNHDLHLLGVFAGIKKAKKSDKLTELLTSPEVDELMALESYAHVHHIVSNISGQKRDNLTPIDVLKAVFPGGTITGCPKVRCMEIIAELEKEGRGPYTGSVGYINHNGSMDFNILIRTIFQQQERLHFRAGAGIVADSVPHRELEETRHKDLQQMMQ